MDDINNKIDELAFSVDAGLIDRLGTELVGKAETAVSELIKNSFDADAQVVNVTFINAYEPGGRLTIEDDGVGMNITQLQSGFMRISSTSKIHEPVSKKFNRTKAGRKGIGRFATQRLGNKLTIITQTIDSVEAIKLTINWGDYKIDADINKIFNKIEYVEKVKPEGTDLIIEGLLDGWSDAIVKRIYRHISELLQPNYLSDTAREKNIGKEDQTFDVRFFRNVDGEISKIADTTKMLFEKALAVIEGHIDSKNVGWCSVSSKSLEVDEANVKIEHTETEIDELGREVLKKNVDTKFLNLNQVRFKLYYFIYNRPAYYGQLLSKVELASIKSQADEFSGIKLYRNGFRVLPYGEVNDDWLRLNRRRFSESGLTNIPFGNYNFFGFVELIDIAGDKFQETASREGLLENKSFQELVEFCHKSLEIARDKLRYAIKKKQEEVGSKRRPLITENSTSTLDRLESLQKNVNQLFATPDLFKDEKFRQETQEFVEQLKDDFQKLLGELGMIRVLAALGLTIGEFTHEVVQFSPSIMGDLEVLSSQQLDLTGLKSLESLKRTITLFTAYTSYFNATVSANISRELKPQNLELVVNNFVKIIQSDLTTQKITFTVEPHGYDIISRPMHSSEWSSILFNLYTNSKKAIRRKDAEGLIKIILERKNNDIIFEFIDNGDGIPEINKPKIFDAFFTTSTPIGFDGPDDDRLTGTGLGLKIVKDIIDSYGGLIKVEDYQKPFSTSIKIQLPASKV